MAGHFLFLTFDFIPFRISKSQKEFNGSLFTEVQNDLLNQRVNKPNGFQKPVRFYA